jgi:hypothetical protein
VTRNQSGTRAIRDPAGLAREIEQSFQVVNHCGDYQVNRSLPRDVVDQGFFGITIDERQHIRDQDRLAENERGDDDGHRRRYRHVGSLEHQHANERNDVQRDEEKNGRRKDREELFLELGEKFGHGKTAPCV